MNNNETYLTCLIKRIEEYFRDSGIYYDCKVTEHEDRDVVVIQTFIMINSNIEEIKTILKNWIYDGTYLSYNSIPINNIAYFYTFKNMNKIEDVRIYNLKTLL